MFLIDELKEKSAKMEASRSEVTAEIISVFEEYLNSDGLENYLRKRIGKTELEERKVFLLVEFWAYLSGCSTTQFRCGGHAWFNPENNDGWESRTYKGFELKTISKEVCDRLSSMLVNRMDELGFHIISKEPQINRLDLPSFHFYFGW